MKTLKISDFINTKYREYWNEQNKGKNVFTPHEQLLEVNRYIIWAAHTLGMKKGDIQKVTTLAGQTGKFYIAGDTTLQESIKGMGSPYRRQPATRVFYGEGNFGYSAGDPGGAARYVYVVGTPLLEAISQDLPFVNMIKDETGLVSPEFISMPFPMMLINGSSQIGLGKAAYYCERDAREVITWIKNNIIKKKESELPKAISSTGCHVWYNEKNGYTVYDAIWKTEGKTDIIMALPPKVSTANAIAILQKKLPSRVNIIDASGEGNPVRIVLPTGYLSKDTLSKYGLQNARKEVHFIWNEELGTVALSSFKEVATLWLKSRREVVRKRLESKKSETKHSIHRINLIQRYVDLGCSTWASETIEKEFGKTDASVVLSCSARMFLPENLEKNTLTKEKLGRKIKEIEKQIANVDEVIILEAEKLIKEQEEFHASLAS